jgi:flagellar biosynthesis/type III secretory pathway ATPase
MYGDKSLDYSVCSNTADPAKYWKMEGAVTSEYALQAFADASADVKYLQDALSRAAGAGVPISAGTSETGFSGDWSKVLTPAEAQTLEKSVNGVGGTGGMQTYVFPVSNNAFGMATGPKGLSAPADGPQVLLPLDQFQQKGREANPPQQ